MCVCVCVNMSGAADSAALYHVCRDWLPTSSAGGSWHGCLFVSDLLVSQTPPWTAFGFLVLSDAADQSKRCLSFHGLLGVTHVSALWIWCFAPPRRPFLTFTRGLDEKENLHIKQQLNLQGNTLFTCSTVIFSVVCLCIVLSHHHYLIIFKWKCQDCLQEEASSEGCCSEGP